MQKPNRNYKICAAILRGFFKVFLKIDITGMENFDKNETYIIAANHKSWLDPLIIMAFFSKTKISTMAEETSALTEGWLKKLIKACDLNMILLDRADQKSRLKGIKQAQKTVKAGGCFLIFPEGRINKNDDKMYPFYLGAFLLAKKNKKKILPIYIRGNEELYFGRRINISIGEAMEIFKDDNLEDIAIRTYKTLNEEVKPEKPVNNSKRKMLDISRIFLGEMAEAIDDSQMIIRGNNASEVFGKVNNTNKEKFNMQ